MSGIRETPAPIDPLIEQLARRISWVHFMRKQHVSADTKEGLAAYLVEKHWENHIDHAEAVFALVAPFRERAEIAEAMLEKLNAPDELLPWHMWKAKRERQIADANAGSTIPVSP